MEELKNLNEERKIQLPDNLPPSPTQDAVADTNGDVVMDDVAELTPVDDENTDDEVPRSTTRGLRRGQDRAAERQRQKERKEERKKEIEAAKAVPKQSKAFVKLLKDIQKKEDFIKKCEEEIAIIDNDLREADCARTRVLGKDRFWNRYYWFERNGMPYAGLPDSSTAESGYANGCIWVQGPDDLEREGYVDLDEGLQNHYRSLFGMTIPERKAKEEGPTSVYNAGQWGYIDDPKDVKKLIDWLDPRGVNEIKFRKELVNYSHKIFAHMENRQKHLGLVDAVDSMDKDKEKDNAEEAKTANGTKSTASKRAAARRAKSPNPEQAQYRCLEWHNSAAIKELGHLHSEPPAPAPPKGKRGGSRKKIVVEAPIEVAEPPAPMKTRSRKKP